MNAYVYQAALLCTDCAYEARDEVVSHAFHGFDPRWFDDSDNYPQGPYPAGGGEADSPQHCDQCSVFLENPLTDEGFSYVSGTLVDVNGVYASDSALAEWAKFYGMAV